MLSNDDEVGGSRGVYFNFDRKQLRELAAGVILTFNAKNPRTGMAGEVKVVGETYGGSMGDSHGRFNGNPIAGAEGQWEAGDLVVIEDKTICNPGNFTMSISSKHLQ